MPPPRVLASPPEWAHECEAPGFAGRARPRGSKALGLSYEKKLAKQLPPGTLHGQWFIYRADGRLGYCQPDFLLRGRSELAVLEAKLGDIEGAFEQLDGLYVPVLQACYAKRTLRIVVSRSLARMPARAEVCEGLVEAISCARRGGAPVLHWIGSGKI